MPRRLPSGRIFRLAFFATLTIGWWLTPAQAQRGHGGSMDCQSCHTPHGWLPAIYADHDQTRFPLNGQHQSVACKSCHLSTFSEPIPNLQCGSCHTDAHAGRLGTFCDACHDERSWKGEFTIDAHRRSAFPLIGAHGVIPCQECHLTAKGAFSTALNPTCVTCHAEQYVATSAISINHGASQFSDQCQSCHYTWGFSPARYQEHEACFRIQSGPHARITCRECHSDLAGGVATGNCESFGDYLCTQCHEHSVERTNEIHVNVIGYSYNDASCVGCHQTGEHP